MSETAKRRQSERERERKGERETQLKETDDGADKGKRRLEKREELPL